MDRPRLKAHLVADVVDDSIVFLLGEEEQFFVQGVQAVKVLPFLDGRHTVGEIAARLSDQLPLLETLSAIRKFQAFGQLADGRPDLPDEELAYWDALGVDPRVAATRIADGHVEVVALDGLPDEPVRAALREVGLRPGTGGSQDLTVVLTADYLSPELADHNAAHLAAGRRWLLAKPVGRSLWLGPLFEPGSTGCWACLAQRLRGNRQVQQYVMRKRNTDVPHGTSLARLRSVPALFGGLLAGEVARVIGAGAGASRLHGRMVTLDLHGLDTLHHELVRQPQCGACGDPGVLAEHRGKVSLTARPARFSGDGGYRAVPPQETYERLERHISPAIGAISSLRPFTDFASNGVTYSYTAGHNFAMAGDNLGLLRRNVRGQSGGKGRTDIQARVSAMCEAIERYSGVWHGDEPVRRATAAELGEDAVLPQDLLRYSATQLANRVAWNADPVNRLHLVTEPLRPDLPIDWATGWSLTDERERWVPAAYAWYGHPDLAAQFFCFGDSNGSASGNNLEEAILQGFCEIVERDSVALWWYNRVRRPGIDLDSIGDPYVDKLRDFYAGMHRSLWLLDITADLGVPTFVGVSHRLDHPVEDIIVGFGAHLDARIAAMRALTEVNQFLPAVARRDDDGNARYMEDDVATLNWWRTATVAAEPWLRPDPGQPARSIADHPVHPAGDLADHVRTCVDLAAAQGLEVIVLNQSRPDFELSVAKVLVPGMRHFWRRLGPGRLYDVPVRLGWLPAPHREDELNPRSVFF